MARSAAGDAGAGVVAMARSSGAPMPPPAARGYAALPVVVSHWRLLPRGGPWLRAPSPPAPPVSGEGAANSDEFFDLAAALATELGDDSDTRRTSNVDAPLDRHEKAIVAVIESPGKAGTLELGRRLAT